MSAHFGLFYFFSYFSLKYLVDTIGRATDSIDPFDQCRVIISNIIDPGRYLISGH